MNPQENDSHTLSTRYGIAVKRIEAIIRLKDLEEQWRKVRETSVTVTLPSSLPRC